MNNFLRGNVKKKHWRPTVFLLESVLIFAFLLPGIAFAAPVPEWGSNGVLIAQDVSTPWVITQIIPDKKGNVFLAWPDQVDTQTKYYVQKLGSDGTPLWSQPVLVVDIKNALFGPNPVVESDGGLIFVWADNRNKRKPDVFAQKLDADGNKLWGGSGKPVYVGPGAQDVRAVVSDQVGGAIVVWRDDERPGCCMQRIDGNGDPQWQADGISINDLCGIQVDDSQFYYGGDRMGDWINVQSDDLGGLYLNWSDIKPNYMMMPMEPGPSQLKQDGHILLQRVNRNGEKVWPANVSVDVKGVAADMMMPNQLMVTGDNSAVIFWTQPNGDPYITKKIGEGSYSSYSNPNANLFAVKVTLDGKLAWDPSNPIISTSGDSNQEMGFMGIPNPTKEGLLYVLPTTRMEKQQEVVQESGPGGGVSTEEIDVPIVTSLKVINIDGAGKTTWTKTIPGESNYPGIVADLKAGGFFLTTAKYLDETPSPIYVEPQLSQLRIQRFDADGNALWQEGGANLTGMTGLPTMGLIPDGAGGFYTGWSKTKPIETDSGTASQPIKAIYRSGPLPPEQMPKADIYVQHFTDDGKVANSWSDVTAEDWSFNYVDGLATVKGAVGGYADGSFKPSSDITRAEFAKMVVVALGIFDDTTTAAANLKGTDAEHHWAFEYIAKAVGAGLMKGYPGGKFRPDAKITRAEASAIIFRAKNLKADAASQEFSDVPAKYWASASIGAMKKLGVIAGYTDGTFRPSSNATRAEAAKMIYKALQLVSKD